MVLLRYLPRIVLISTLAAGCSQSLFDDGSGRDGAPDPARPDGSIAPPEDGSAIIPDGGMVMAPDAGVGVPDDGGPPADARPPRLTCPSPCQGDAYLDYDNAQGGSNGRWSYVEFQPENETEPYVLMQGDPAGWVGTGPTLPRISKCASTDPDPPQCQELFETIALTTASPGLGVHHPGLMWTAPAAGNYYMSGTLQVASTAPAQQITATLTRNRVPVELIRTETTELTTLPYFFETNLYADAGEEIVLTVSAFRELTSVGVNFYVSGPMAAASGGSW